MSNNYTSALGVSGGGVQPTGNAQPADVLSGKTFSNADGVGKTGTMVNNGAVSETLAAGQSYTVPEGYHNGSGTVTAQSATLHKIKSDLTCATGSYPQTTSIDCSDVTGYQNFTQNDFVVVPKTGTTYNAQGNTGSWNSTQAAYIVGYDNTTGILSYRNGHQQEYVSFRIATVDVYVLY